MSTRESRSQVVLRVDLSSRSVKQETLPESFTAAYLGARGVTGRLLYDEVRPGTDPLGPDNVLYLGTGPLDGLPVGMGRLSIACKSPRGSIAEGSSGGFWGPELRRAGYDYIAIRGISEEPVYLYLENDKVEIRDARHL